MTKELTENPLIIGTLLALFAHIVFPFFKWVFHAKNKELEGKVNNKDQKIIHEKDEEARELREEGMKSWVKLTILEFVTNAVKELKMMIKEMEDKNDKKFKEIMNLFEQYRKDKHEELNKISQYEGTVKICKDALNQAERVMLLADKMNRLA